MADRVGESHVNEKANIFHQNATFTSIIPMLQELRRQKGPIDIIPGIPQPQRPPQQIKIENIMESCVFKSTLAGVLGKISWFVGDEYTNDGSSGLGYSFS